MLEVLVAAFWPILLIGGIILVGAAVAAIGDAANFLLRKPPE